jgi:hypothetical protein
VAEPLAAVLEAAYSSGGSEKSKVARRDLLDAIALTRNEQGSPASDWRVLESLAKLAETEDPLVASASELAAKVNDPDIDEHVIAAVLRRHEFKTKSIRKEGDPRYRFSLPHSLLADLAARHSGSYRTELSKSEPLPGVENVV